MSEIILKYIGHLYYREGSGGTIEITDIAVLGERQKKGFGRRMIDELKSKVSTNLIWAITRESNIGAHQFYEHTGFILIALLPNFYKDESARMYGIYL